MKKFIHILRDASIREIGRRTNQQPTDTDTDRPNFCTELFTIKDGTRALVGALVGRGVFKKTGGNANYNLLTLY